MGDRGMVVTESYHLKVQTLGTVEDDTLLS